MMVITLRVAALPFRSANSGFRPVVKSLDMAALKGKSSTRANAVCSRVQTTVTGKRFARCIGNVRRVRPNCIFELETIT